MRVLQRIVLCATILTAGEVLASDLVISCNRARALAWRNYASCVQSGATKLIVCTEQTEFVAFLRCRHRYFNRWTKFQTNPVLAGSECTGSRFTDNGDGTVTDNLNGLVWEKKQNLDATPNLSDPH